MESFVNLFQVHQRYLHNPDVVIIAVHNRIAPTLNDAYAKSSVARKKLWGGTEFPFPVALDDGRMYRAYGISGIPRRRHDRPRRNCRATLLACGGTWIQ